MHERAPLSPGEKVTVVNSQVGYGLEGAEIHLLSLCLSRVVGATGDTRCKVAYVINLMLGEKKSRQSPDIQPPIWCRAQGSIIKIESVYVDDSTDDIPPKS